MVGLPASNNLPLDFLGDPHPCHYLYMQGMRICRAKVREYLRSGLTIDRFG